MQLNLSDNEKRKIKLTKIYENYKNRMYITACRILKDPYLAEDAVHNAFVAISRNLSSIGEPDSIKTASYVIKAAKNTAINMLKKAETEIPTLLTEEEIFKDEEALDEICQRENYNYIIKAILSLDEKYRDVLSFYYLNELTIKEISDSLGRKENTVKAQLARGRRKLIELIKEEVNKNEKEFYASEGF